MEQITKPPNLSHRAVNTITSISVQTTLPFYLGPKALVEEAEQYMASFDRGSKLVGSIVTANASATIVALVCNPDREYNPGGCTDETSILATHLSQSIWVSDFEVKFEEDGGTSSMSGDVSCIFQSKSSKTADCTTNFMMEILKPGISSTPTAVNAVGAVQWKREVHGDAVNLDHIPITAGIEKLKGKRNSATTGNVSLWAVLLVSSYLALLML